MSQRIIKPEGIELMKYLNDGYAICDKCGAVMNRKDGLVGENDIYVCPSCGWKIDVMDYEYKDDDKEKEYVSEIKKYYKDDIPPPGCRACGGHYPDCKTSCKLFDD